MGSIGNMLTRLLFVCTFGLVFAVLKLLWSLIRDLFRGIGYIFGFAGSKLAAKKEMSKQEIVESNSSTNYSEYEAEQPKEYTYDESSYSDSGEENVYREVDEITASYDETKRVAKSQPIQKKNIKGKVIILIVVGIIVFLFLPVPLLPIAIILFGAIGLYLYHSSKKPQRDTENLVTCTECGIQEPISLMITCPVCGAILCSSCKKHHGCITDSEPLMQQSKMNGVEKPIVNSGSQELVTCMGCGKQHPKSDMRKCHTCGAVLCPSCRKHHTCGEEMVECMGCGEQYPKSSMRKCHTCGDVLCPSCRKHHVCGSSKTESLDVFTESGPQKPSTNTMTADEQSEPSVTSVIPEAPSDDAKEWFKTGMMYYEGDGVEKDTEQAVYWYTKSAEAGYVMAQALLGLHYLNSGNLSDASLWLRKADEGGLVLSDILPDVMNTIANAFMKGDYDAEALHWYTRGAEQGNAECQYMLGLQYIANLIVEKDYRKAVYWLEKADKQGHAEAHERLGSTQYDLGNSYYYGWYNLAEDKTEAAKWYEKSALNGYAEGQREIGHCYLHGVGVSANPEKAIYWLKKAVEQNDPEAKTIMALMYLHGNHLPEDDKKAFQLLKEAAEADEPDENAFAILGTCYCDGMGVKQDLEKARYWLQKSIDAGVNLDEIREVSKLYPMLRLSI